MDSLPEELMRMIFAYLNIQELKGRASLVSKKWNYIIKRLNFKELILKRIDMHISNQWDYTCRPIDLNNIIFSFNVRILDNEYFKTYFFNLKRLKVHLHKNDVENLNHYVMLEHLEIENEISLNRNVTLKLKKLRIASVPVLYLDDNILTVDSNNLEVLITGCLERIKVTNPTTVKFIDVCRETVYSLRMNLTKFTNLEVFHVYSFSHHDEFLSKSPSSLKEIHIWHSKRNENNFPRYLEMKKRFMMSLLDQKYRDARFKDLKIYMKGLEMNFETFSRDFDKFYQDVCFRNFNELSDTVRLSEINYNNVENAFDQELPSNFFSKFQTISQIVSADVKDQNHFLDFLSKCSVLSNLTLRSSSLDQSFYDRLPECCRLLKSIDLNFYSKDSGYEIEFDFILKFKILNQILANQEPPISIIMQLLENKMIMGHFVFQTKSKFTFIKTHFTNRQKYYELEFSDTRQYISDLENLRSILDFWFKL